MTERRKIKFGTSGWRGILADDFTFDNVKIVAQAIATELLKEPKIKNGALIGYDTRFMTEEFAWTIAQVFAGNNIRTFVCREPTPTPVLSYTIRKNDLAGGVNITASHNPFYWNGIKYNPENGGPALPEVTKRIEEEIEKIIEGKSELHFLSHQDEDFGRFVNAIEPNNDYKATLLRRIDVDRIRNVIKKVCIDLSYSTGIDYLDALLREILQTDSEETIILLNDYRDPYFGGDRPEPDKKRLRELGKTVSEHKAQIGLTIDGDADRFGIVDDLGGSVTANEYLAIAAWHLYKNKGLKGGGARSIATSHAIDRVAGHYGYETKVTPVGFKFIGEALLYEGIVLGGEESGGLSIQNHVPEKDGILACLLALEVIAYEEKPLSEIRKEVEKITGKFYNDRIDLELESDRKKKEIMDFFEQLHREVFGFPVKEKTSIDGIGFVLDTKEKESWILVRASGTEPVIRIYIESDDIDIYEKLKAGVEKIG
jgi:alpha-D-glucose phosphate-specific phosphoglucomutase